MTYINIDIKAGEQNYLKTREIFKTECSGVLFHRKEKSKTVNGFNRKRQCSKKDNSYIVHKTTHFKSEVDHLVIHER